MTGILQDLRWQDVLDVAIIAFIAYKVVDLIRGTRAAQMIVGLVIVFATYLASQYFELHTLNWLLDNFLASMILVIVVIFQNDIRRALTQVGSGPAFLTGAERVAQGQALEELVRATATLAGRRIGALIVIERDVRLKEFVEIGTELDARVSRELLQSIFIPTSPIHDGAVILKEGRIVAAGCFLPLTTNPNISKTLGTRHRAAIGLTEETDAIAVVVSEEDGKISVVRQGRITRNLDAATLRATLQETLSS